MNAFISLLLHGIFLCMSDIDQVQSSKFKVTYPASSYNKYLENVEFIRNTAYTFHQCMDICNRFAYCKSVNYLKSIKKCILNYKAADPPETIQSKHSPITQEGSRYMAKTDFPSVLLDQGCIGHSCELENLCVNTGKCSQWLYNDCGMVDEDDFADTEYPVNGDFNTAIHTCFRAPAGKSGITTRRCNNKTGRWSPPEAPCPMTCLKPPKVREEQVVTYKYFSGSIVTAFYSCSAYTDPSPTPSCLRLDCDGGENWTWRNGLRLSCSEYDRWKPGTYYRGGVMCTKSGRTCQRWNTNWPHRPHYTPVDPTANYCRTDAHGKPWCYTTDPAVRWEECDVQIFS